VYPNRHNQKTVKANQTILLVVLVFAVLAAAAALVRLQGAPASLPDAWARMPKHPAHVDHSRFFDEPFPDGPSVTRACLKCHEQQARDFMTTQHWRWKGDPVRVPGHDKPVAIGKANLINNFCISIQTNWPKCTSCHAGYNWTDAHFDFSDSTKVDCLVCHDHSGTYSKGTAGNPAQGTDLLAAARSVGLPDRTNCGVCHFNGGGGDAVKHGDLDQTMYFPTRDIDVHMGGYGFQCIDCHNGKHHRIPGRSMSVSINDVSGIGCTDCHNEAPHRNERLNAHVKTVACQSCHIPEFAVREATKMYWDWSEAGQDLPIDDPHEYLKIKGRFRYERQVVPEYYWYNGTADRYLKGDRINTAGVTDLNHPRGDTRDASAKIWPFKVHRGKQIYDTVHNYLLIPKTVGPDGYWTKFDWDQALRLAEPVTGLEYSGSYGWAETAMYWPLSHMVAPKERSLQCAQCHGPHGRMDWQALGFPGDPAVGGGRAQNKLLSTTTGGEPR
jgi:octaheme c-type cytochrome (tetrathionate reductase family)